MHRTQKVSPRAALFVVLCVLALLVPASAASAASERWGEITRFGLGAAGGTPGDLNDEHRTRLLGVDPTDNSAYVLDEPSEEEEAEKKIKVGQPGCPEEPEEPEQEPCEISIGPITRHFRLQKFAATGGKYSAVASAAFAEEAPAPAGGKKPTGAELELAAKFEEEVLRSRGLAVEGIAVDPALGRLYVLATDFRQPTLSVDSAGVEAPLNERKALPVAATLYAYSTHAQGTALTPAVGANPVLVGPAALGAQSTAPGQALLEPAGITVDPETHDVIVLAHIDEAGAAQDNLQSSGDHFVLQRIHDTGALGARYIDRANFFAKESIIELRPHSPIVVGPEKKEHVDVGYKRGLQPAGIVELPDNFESSEAPKTFFSPPAESVVEEWVRSPNQSNGPNILGPLVGGALTASPEGTIFGAGVIKLEELGSYQAVTALSGTDGSIEGWTGGQAQNPEAKPEERYLCTIEPLYYNPATPIAAGSGGDVFVLAPAYLFDRDLTSSNEIELYGPPAAPAVIELGPGGAGCPAAKSRELIATLGGAPLGGRAVQLGQQLGFSAKLTQADALSVEWNFGDGVTESVPVQKKPQEPQVKHAFAVGGARTVTATIRTDDLATPTITLATHVMVEGGVETQKEREEREARELKEKEEQKRKEEHETEQERKEREARELKEKEEQKGKEEHKENGPHALGVAPSPAYRGLPGLFNASPSWDSAGPNEITEYHWTFGDGGEYAGPVPIVFHTYSALGSYIATLTVGDRQGHASARYSLTVKVVEPPSPPPAAAGRASPPSAPASAVASFTHATPRVFPDVTLAIASLRANAKGSVVLAMYCPAGETTCAGTVKLRALLAAVSRRSKRPNKALTTLASGSFKIPGGTRKRITLHLTHNVLVLLARLRRVYAQAEIVAHDLAGATHSAKLPVLISAPPPARIDRAKHR
jgi:PKD domain